VVRIRFASAGESGGEPDFFRGAENPVPMAVRGFSPRGWLEIFP